MNFGQSPRGPRQGDFNGDAYVNDTDFNVMSANFGVYLPPAPVAHPTLTATAVSATQVDLSWNDNSNGEDGFRVDVSFDGVGFEGLVEVASNTTSYLWTSAYPNAVLFFRVVAFDATFGSAASNSASVQTAPLAPEHIATATASTGQIDIAWGGISSPTESPITNHLLERRPDGGVWSAPVTLAADATTYSDTGLTEGTMYEYRLRRSNAAGTSQYSEVIEAYTLPANPTGLTAALKFDKQIDLSWTDNSGGETAYIIEGSAAGGAWRTFGTVAANITSYSVTDLAGAVQYDFRVRARNAAGESDPSNTAGATTKCGWFTYGEATISGQTVTLGVAGRPEVGVEQQPGVHGASIRVAPAASYTLTLDRNLSTWDSYNASTNNGHTGYWDSFSVSLTDQPYPQMSLTDPLSLPFLWGGSSYNDGNLETNVGTGTIPLTGDASKPMYLNVVLDTNTATEVDEKYPSWGTITITSPSVSSYCPPVVSVEATQPQAAEGASSEAQGRFTVYREASDKSQPLTVNYTVETGTGQATAGSDYSGLSGSVTILAGAESAIIDVTALADSDASEETEPVTLTLAAAPGYATRPAAARAVVKVLNRQAYLVPFYGRGGPATYADRWLDKLVDELKADASYRADKKYQHDEGGEALIDFLGAIDADGNMEISRAEAESSDLRVVGYSYGGTQAINFTRDLNRDVWFGGREARKNGITLKATVPVKKLVTIDPVETLRIGGRSIPGPWKHRTGSVETNVKQFANYYEQSRRVANYEELVGGVPTGNIVKIGDDLGEKGAVLIIGGHMPSNLPAAQEFQGRVDTDPVMSGEWKVRDRVNALDAPVAGKTWRLNGLHANHLSVMWWSYDKAKQDLMP